ncbi:MAG: head-tail connector protein, partial [Acinetobacter sp.]|uniref:head-tail connector protein n=1 Tax=Acinetobacter sp. TaxID=472 RepID=UPI0039188FB2
AYKNPVNIRYDTGMDFVPPVVRHAILMTAAELFEVRTESTDAQARVAQITISRLLMSNRKVVV